MIIISTLAVLGIVAILFLFIIYRFEHEHVSSKVLTSSTSYTSFRNKFLLVKFLIFCSDWLQGPFLYQLYLSYGYEMNTIVIFFMISYISGITFGTLIGSLADYWGRRKACILFCFLYSFNCFLLQFNHFEVLIIGRILAGTSKNLLFTIFEAWMVHEHYKLGFSNKQLRDTFSWSNFIAGSAAILSGLVAHVFVSHFGLQSPYLLATALLTISCLVILRCWEENFGSPEQFPSNFFDTAAFRRGLSTISKDPCILSIGILQSVLEAALLTFGFVWPPALKQSSITDLPYGLIFTCLILSMMVGSLVFRLLDIFTQVQIEIIALVAVILSSASLLISSFTEMFVIKFVWFIMFEFAIGMFLPIIASLRHQFIPASTRSTILSLFRVPLSLLVVFLLSCVNSYPLKTLFIICSAISSLGIPCLVFIIFYQPRSKPVSESTSLI